MKDVYDPIGPSQKTICFPSTKTESFIATMTQLWSIAAFIFVACTSSNNVVVVSQTTAVAAGTLAHEVQNFTDDISGENALSIFSNALKSTKMLEELLGNETRTFTVFAPTNQAMMASPVMSLFLHGSNGTETPTWNRHLMTALRHHIVPDFLLNRTEIFNNQRVEIMSIQEGINISQFEQTIHGSQLVEYDIPATNGILHVVNKVLEPNFFKQTFSQLELQEEFGPDHLDRTAMVDVVDLVKGRDILDEIRPDGQTFVGCRIRAFNRLEEYLPQAINGSPEGVIRGEFLNITNRNETIHDFIRYSMIPKNYYSADIPNGFMELTIPVPNCGHMWVTKKDDLLCFNNGCVVETPDPREYLASNG
jgi:uncharacterized surface protein with fasciclin (FAS1) repeats